MRVLQVIPAVAARYGGPSRAILEMCRALAGQGVEVLLAATDVDGRGRLEVQTGREIEYQGVRAIFFRGRLERFNYSPPMVRWLNANVAQFQVVHIHAVFSHPCLAAARACRNHGVSYIVRPLGSLDPWSLSQKPLRKGIMWRVGAGRMLREAAAIHYTTTEEKRLAEAALQHDRGVVIPLGVDLGAIQDPAGDMFRQQHPSLADNPYVLALSRIHPKKNLELLIEAFLNAARGPALEHWRLVIAGDGEPRYLATLRGQVARSGGRDSVVFAGWLEGEMRRSAIQQASLFAMPSQQENFGIAAAEALACGVPVVVSERVNLAPELAREDAGWVSSLDAGELARTLEEAMGHSEERESRGRAGRRFVESNLSWEKAASELVKLYSTIVEATAATASAATS